MLLILKTAVVEFYDTVVWILPFTLSSVVAIVPLKSVPTTTTVQYLLVSSQAVEIPVTSGIVSV